MALYLEERWEVIDTKSGERMGNLHRDRKAARRKADKLDLEYGANRYVVCVVAEPLPGPVDVAWISEYDLRQKLSNSLRCF
jgi:hypothetical protein